jgi:hypothetical protein
VQLASKEAAPSTITPNEPWHFTIAASGWMPGMDGTVGLHGIDANVDIDFGEILRHLEHSNRKKYLPGYAA